MKELTEEFKGKSTCLGENTEKYNLVSSNRKKLNELVKTDKKFKKV